MDIIRYRSYCISSNCATPLNNTAVQCYWVKTAHLLVVLHVLYVLNLTHVLLLLKSHYGDVRLELSSSLTQTTHSRL